MYQSLKGQASELIRFGRERLLLLLLLLRLSFAHRQSISPLSWGGTGVARSYCWPEAKLPERECVCVWGGVGEKKKRQREKGEKEEGVRRHQTS